MKKNINVKLFNIITLNKKNFLKKPGEKIFIPREAIHRIENKFKKKVKIIQGQENLGVDEFNDNINIDESDKINDL